MHANASLRVHIYLRFLGSVVSLLAENSEKRVSAKFYSARLCNNVLYIEPFLTPIPGVVFQRHKCDAAFLRPIALSLFPDTYSIKYSIYDAEFFHELIEHRSYLCYDPSELENAATAGIA